MCATTPTIVNHGLDEPIPPRCRRLPTGSSFGKKLFASVSSITATGAEVSESLSTIRADAQGERQDGNSRKSEGLWTNLRVADDTGCSLCCKWSCLLRQNSP